MIVFNITLHCTRIKNTMAYQAHRKPAKPQEPRQRCHPWITERVAVRGFPWSLHYATRLMSFGWCLNMDEFQNLLAMQCLDSVKEAAMVGICCCFVVLFFCFCFWLCFCLFVWLYVSLIMWFLFVWGNGRFPSYPRTLLVFVIFLCLKVLENNKLRCVPVTNFSSFTFVGMHVNQNYKPNQGTITNFEEWTFWIGTKTPPCQSICFHRVHHKHRKLHGQNRAPKDWYR